MDYDLHEYLEPFACWYLTHFEIDDTESEHQWWPIQELDEVPHHIDEFIYICEDCDEVKTLSLVYALDQVVDYLEFLESLVSSNSALTEEVERYWERKSEQEDREGGESNG